MTAPPPRLVAITPSGSEAELPALLRAIGAAAEAGLRGLVLRLPDVPDRPYLTLALAARERLGSGAWLALHDRPHLARAARADAVHLGFRSLAPAEARIVVGADVALGFSAHATDDPTRLAADGVDHFSFGPVRPTPSKAGLLEPTGLDGLARFCAAAPRPVLALGGLGPLDAAPCRVAGAHGVAAIGALLAAPDPGAATRAFLAALAEEVPR